MTLRYAVLIAWGLLVPGLLAADSPPAHQAIHPPERIFKPDAVKEALQRAERGNGWMGLRGLAEKIAAPQTLLKNLQQAVEAANGESPKAGAPLDPQRIEPLARLFREQLQNNPQLLQRIWNDPKHRQTLERLVKEWGPKVGELGRSDPADLPPATREALESLADAVRQQLPSLAARGSPLPQQPALGDQSPPAERPAPAQRTPPPTTAKRDPAANAAVEKLLQAARQMSKAGGPLADSPTLGRVIERLNEKAAAPGGIDPALPAELRRFIDSLGWGRAVPSLPTAQRWGAAAQKRAQAVMPKSLPTPPIPKWPALSGQWPRFSPPRFASPSLPGAPSLPSGPGIDPAGLARGAAVAFGLFVIGFVVVLLSRKRLHRWSLGQQCRRLLVDSSLGPRQRICLVFEQLAVELLGESARPNHHRRIAERLRLSSPYPATAEAADRLADVYEQARYTPPDEPVSTEAVELVEHHFALLLR